MTASNTAVLQTPDLKAGYEDEMIAVLHGLVSLRRGVVGARLPIEWSGLAGKVADAFNEVIEMNERLAEELRRLSQTVGKEGRISQRLSLSGADGFWRESVGHVNSLIG